MSILKQFYNDKDVIDILSISFTFNKINHFTNKVVSLFETEFGVSIQSLIRAIPLETIQLGGTRARTQQPQEGKLLQLMRSIFKRFCFFIDRRNPRQYLTIEQMRPQPPHTPIDISPVFNLLFNMLGLIYAFGTAFFIILSDRILNYLGYEYDGGKKRKQKSKKRKQKSKKNNEDPVTIPATILSL